MKGLTALALKQPIVSTYGAEALRTSAEEVRTAYDWHAATYVEQPPLADLRRSFIAAIRSAKTPKAALVAPFGYGKTASAIGIWRACQRDGLLAVPPVSCSSFPDIARAVRDWIAFVEPSQDGAMAAAYERFLDASTEVLARRDERDYGIPFNQGYAALRDKLERGYLDFEDVSLNLLAFLERATAAAIEAGYPGLVVIIDEFQQLLGNTTKGTLVALRQLVWGLRTRELALGLLITMDPDTEHTLADRAGDILHRIKDDGLYLNLQHIYDREFPARTWEQYVDALGLQGAARDAIDRPGLDSIGQLCERDDLSNGPRMVINALQLAAARAETDGSAPYGPLDFVNDLVSGAIRFDGDRSIVPTLLAELLDFPYFQRSAELSSALRLLAAFPRGCSEEIARRYGLLDAWRQLGDELRGDIVTELEEGLTLVELQRVGRPANRLNVLLRRYWMQITDQQLFAEDAPKTFAEVVVPLLFPAKKNDLNGWDGEAQLSADGDYSGILEGTSSARFPMRRVSVHVADAATTRARDVDPKTDADFALTFSLDLDPTATSSTTIHDDGKRIDVSLALTKVAPDGLRGGLAWIAHYLSPQPVSPALILSLLRYLGREGAGNPDSRDQARVNDTIARLQAWLLTELLPPDAFRGLDFDVVQAGQGGLQEFLFGLAARRWPDYKSLAVHQHWMSLLSDYEKALQEITPAERVGIAPVRDTKANVAAMFGQARHAGFESRARQYGELLRIDRWVGDEGVVTFVPHRAELHLAAAVRDAGQMGRGEAYELLRGIGYAAAETRALIRLAQLRQLVTDDGEVLCAPNAPTPAELHRTIADLEARIAYLDGATSLREPLTAVRAELSQGGDPSEASWRLEMLAQRVTEQEAEHRQVAQARRQRARAQVLDGIATLQPATRPSLCPVDLSRHLHALHARSDHDSQQLRIAADRVLAAVEADPIELEALADRLAAWRDKEALIRRWGVLAERVEALMRAVIRLNRDGRELDRVWTEANEIVREAREILSGRGEAALQEVARLEPLAAQVERRFLAADRERATAFEKAVASLARELQEVLGLARPPALPDYDVADDEGSWRRVTDAAATLISRAVALWSLEVEDGRESKGIDLVRAKLRADIRSSASRALRERWVETQPRLALSKAAVRELRALRHRVNKHMASDDSAPARSQVAKVLLSLPPGPTDLSLILERVNGNTGHQGIIDDLVRLHQAGSLRLLIDVTPPVSD